MTTTEGQPLTKGQGIILGIATTAMIGIGVLGAIGTYTNLTGTFAGPTALGAVAAGEGATLILALVYVGLTMLGQAAPAAVRLGLWALPAVAASVGAVAAQGPTATVVYAVTPMAMCTAAEGSGLLARRIVIRTTGQDAETQRRNATVMRRLAYERARAERHPGRAVRWFAERRAWRLARHVGTGDTRLGTNLVTVQRERVTAGADAALAAMYGAVVEAPALPAAVTPVTAPDTQATAPETDPEPMADTAPDTDDEEPDTAVTLAQVAAVAGVPVPRAGKGEQLSDEQILVLLRYFRYQDDPPMSYRQAALTYRLAGFSGSEERIRKAWSVIKQTEGAPIA